MKVFSVVLLSALFVAAVHSAALPEEDAAAASAQEPIITVAMELEEKLGKVLRSKRVDLEFFEKTLGEPRATTIANINKVQEQLNEKAGE